MKNIACLIVAALTSCAAACTNNVGNACQALQQGTYSVSYSDQNTNEPTLCIPPIGTQTAVLGIGGWNSTYQKNGCTETSSTNDSVCSSNTVFVCPITVTYNSEQYKGNITYVIASDVSEVGDDVVHIDATIVYDNGQGQCGMSYVTTYTRLHN